jgi:peptidoglycan/LPS O-acetylase OafA/YrhL
MANTNRMTFLDNLRAFVVILVIVLHGSMSYMAYAPTWWYVLDKQTSLVFTMLVLLVDVPIMPIMFFIAGYFALPSLRRRGARAFVKEKGVRIGLPWVFGALFLAPLTAYMIYVSRQVPMGYLQFWATDFWGDLYQQSVYWFLGILFAMFVVLALVYTRSRRLRDAAPVRTTPSRKVFALFAALTTAGALLMGLIFPLDTWSHVYLFVFQPVRVPFYIAYFVLGLYAHDHGWFQPEGYVPSVWTWLWACVLSGIAYLAVRMGAPSSPGAPFVFQALTALLFSVFCMAALFAGVAVFREKVDGVGRVWSSLAANSYGMYYIHPLILYPLAYVFVAITLPLFLKAFVVIALAILLSWAVSAFVLKKAPLLRKVF